MNLKKSFNKLITVDSSDQDNISFKAHYEVFYIKSNHKNQPYQRYLGYLSSTADYLLYLDDDMEIINSNLFQVLQDLIVTTDHPAGVAQAFKDKHVINSLSIISPRSTLKTKARLFDVLHWFTGYLKLGHGKLGYFRILYILMLIGF